jgi:hypothetical protein
MVGLHVLGLIKRLGCSRMVFVEYGAFNIEYVFVAKIEQSAGNLQWRRNKFVGLTKRAVQSMRTWWFTLGMILNATPVHIPNTWLMCSRPWIRLQTL